MKLSIPLKNIMLATGSRFDLSSSPERAVNIEGHAEGGEGSRTDAEVSMNPN